MPQTNEGLTVYPPYQPGICNGINKAGKPCVAAVAVPGGLRCKFHPVDKYASYADPPAPSMEQPVSALTPAAARIAAALDVNLQDVPVDSPETFRLGAEVFGTEETEEADADADLYDTEAGQQPQAATKLVNNSEANGNIGSQAGADIPAGYEERFVYDGDLDDYIKAVVPIETAPARVIDPDVYHDGFELGRAYHEGDGAAFDYRFCNDDPRQNLIDRNNGFVPVKKALDNRFRVEGGVVKNGDLVLMRRPKEVTAQRAREMTRTHERLVGEVQDYKNEGRRIGVDTFGGVTADDNFRDERDPDEVRLARQRSEERRPEPRGRKTFAIPSLPWQRDLVAERHGAVGG